MWIKNICSGIILLVAVATMHGQDAHLSQFYASPLLLNPALTGTSSSLVRVSAGYRDQWRAAVDDPFRTYNLSADMGIELNEKSNFSDKVAAGVNFFGDRVSTFDFNTTQFSAYGAYHKGLNSKLKSYLSAGLYLGLGQRNLNYEDIFFEDQFNSVDGYPLATSEVLPVNNFGYFDMGLGIHFTMSPSEGDQFYAGVGIFHIHEPNLSFYKNDRTNNPDLITENPLDRKFTLYTGYGFGLNEWWKIEPRALALLQGINREINIGANFRRKLNPEGSSYLHFGPWLRFTDNQSGIGTESIILSLGIEWKDYLIGISYDQGYNDITSDRVGLNSLELSLIYFGNYESGDDYCPRF